MLLAKVVTTTLFFVFAMIDSSSLPTSASLGLVPSRMAFVESQISARIPLSPRTLRRSPSVGLPTIGVGSSFQSPECRDRTGVCVDCNCIGFRDRMRHCNILQVERPRRKKRLALLCTTVTGMSGAPVLRTFFCCKQACGERCHVDRGFQLRPEVKKRPEMILMSMGNDDRNEVVLSLKQEVDIGQHAVYTGQIILRERNAHIDREPLALATAAISVKGEIHTDLTKPRPRQQKTNWSLAIDTFRLIRSCEE